MPGWSVLWYAMFSVEQISAVAVRVSTQQSADVATNGKHSNLLLQGKSSRSMT
jgi:hypothetical protein